MFVTQAPAEMVAVVIFPPWIDTPVAALLDGKVKIYIQKLTYIMIFKYT